MISKGKKRKVGSGNGGSARQRLCKIKATLITAMKKLHKALKYSQERKTRKNSNISADYDVHAKK